jgi:hypothetical protein
MFLGQGFVLELSEAKYLTAIFQNSIGLPLIIAFFFCCEIVFIIIGCFHKTNLFIQTMYNTYSQNLLFDY